MPAGKMISINKNMFSLNYLNKFYKKNENTINCLLALLIGFLFAKYILTNNYQTKNLFKLDSSKKKTCGN